MSERQSRLFRFLADVDDHRARALIVLAAKMALVDSDVIGRQDMIARLDDFSRIQLQIIDAQNASGGEGS